MKQPPYTSAPLMGSSAGKHGLRQMLLGHLSGSSYYEAHSEQNGTYILWMEFPRFGTLLAYPCVLDEPGEIPLVFTTFSNAGDENDRLIQRWNELISPAYFSSLRVSKLNKEEFQKIYRAYQER